MNIKRYAPKIATYIFTQATTNTESGAHCVFFDEIEDYYGIEDLKNNQELLDAIENHLNVDFGHFIGDLFVYEDHFDLMLWTNYCINDVEDEDELWEDEE